MLKHASQSNPALTLAECRIRFNGLYRRVPTSSGWHTTLKEFHLKINNASTMPKTHDAFRTDLQSVIDYIEGYDGWARMFGGGSTTLPELRKLLNEIPTTAQYREHFQMLVQAQAYAQAQAEQRRLKEAEERAAREAEVERMFEPVRAGQSEKEDESADEANPEFDEVPLSDDEFKTADDASTPKTAAEVAHEPALLEDQPEPEPEPQAPLPETHAPRPQVAAEAEQVRVASADEIEAIAQQLQQSKFEPESLDREPVLSFLSDSQGGLMSLASGLGFMAVDKEPSTRTHPRDRHKDWAARTFGI